MSSATIYNGWNITRFETYSDDKGIVVLQSLNVSRLSVIPTIFYGFKSLKIACVNYAHFPKSDHIWLILCLYCFHELLAQLLNTLTVYLVYYYNAC